MTLTVRGFEASDLETIVALSLKAWAPVFASLETVLGPSGLFARLHPDWRVDQQQAVESVCRDANTSVWVADGDSGVTGFVAARLDQQAGIGEIVMIAVDPQYQRRGLGERLMSVALDWIRDQGMGVAMVETGADPGHAPARELYDQAGFTQLPLARYFKKL